MRLGGQRGAVITLLSPPAVPNGPPWLGRAHRWRVAGLGLGALLPLIKASAPLQGDRPLLLSHSPPRMRSP